LILKEKNSIILITFTWFSQAEKRPER